MEIEEKRETQVQRDIEWKIQDGYSWYKHTNKMSLDP